MYDFWYARIQKDCIEFKPSMEATVSLFSIEKITIDQTFTRS